MDFSTLVSSIATNPAPALLALAVLALAWIYREKQRREEAAESRVSALYELHIKAVQDMNAAHLNTALQVAPIAAKLAECVSLFERVVLTRAGGQQP